MKTIPLSGIQLNGIVVCIVEQNDQLEAARGAYVVKIS